MLGRVQKLFLLFQQCFKQLYPQSPYNKRFYCKGFIQKIPSIFSHILHHLEKTKNKMKDFSQKKTLSTTIKEIIHNAVKSNKKSMF